MSITLNELQAWSEKLPDDTGEEAAMLRAMIARREAELRLRIADLIATVSERENWKLHQCAATARKIEQTPVNLLESVYQYFQDRNNGHAHFEAPGIVHSPAESQLPDTSIEIKPVSTTPIALTRLPTSGSLVDLYSRMRTLESLVSTTPGIGCGIQGIRIMRMVALMSKARSARLAQMRITGTQAIYRHA